MCIPTGTSGVDERASTNLLSACDERVLNGQHDALETMGVPHEVTFAGAGAEGVENDEGLGRIVGNAWRQFTHDEGLEEF